MALTSKEHEILIDWLERYTIPQENINYTIDTSHIRIAFMKTYAHGFYLSNELVNQAMQEIGYHAVNLSHDPYLCFNISNQSPAIREYHVWVSNQSTYQAYE